MVVISASAAAIVGTIKLLSKPTATVINFSSKLKELISMLRVLEPLLEKIAILNRQLNRPQSETDIFISLFNQGEQLVCKCYTIEEWDVINRWRYSKKLSDFQSLLRDVCRVLLITLEMSEATDGVPAPANCSCLEEMGN